MYSVLFSSFAFTCKSERPLSGLETVYDLACYFKCITCKSERPLSGLETLLPHSGVVESLLLAKVNDRLAVWRQFKPLLRAFDGMGSCKSERPLSGLETIKTAHPWAVYSFLAKVNDRLAVWRPSQK